MSKIRCRIANTVILCLVALNGAIIFGAYNLYTPSIMLVILFLFSLTILVFYVRDYLCYRNMTKQLQGKDLKTRLDIIYKNAVVWLIYAEPEDIKDLKNIYNELSPYHPEYKRLKLLVERAVMYKK